MIEIKITGNTANDVMLDLFKLASAWAQEPQEATGGPAEGEGVKLPTETPPSPQEPTSAKSEPVSPMVKQFASPDGSNVKQCIRKEDFRTIKQKVAEFIQKDKAANSKALKQFLADHGSHKLSELDEKFIPDLQKLIEGDAVA